MPRQPTAPSEADAPRPLARAIAHARIPATLKLLLLALLAAFSMAETTGRTLRHLRQDWLFSTNTHLGEDLDCARDPYVLRRLLQLRAELGWRMRGQPNRGMARSGMRAPEICPEQAARAPPQPPRSTRSPRIRRPNPASGGDDSRPHSRRAGFSPPPRRGRAP